MLDGWGVDWEVDLPEVVGGGGAVAREDEGVVVVYVDDVGGEGGCASGITKLADGDEGSITKGGKEVDCAGSSREIGEVQVDLVG